MALIPNQIETNKMLARRLMNARMTAFSRLVYNADKVLNKEALFTLPLGIKGLSTGFRNDYGAQILGLSVGTIPILVFFSFFSKNLISGLSAVAVKG